MNWGGVESAEQVLHRTHTHTHTRASFSNSVLGPRSSVLGPSGLYTSEIIILAPFHRRHPVVILLLLPPPPPPHTDPSYTPQPFAAVVVVVLPPRIYSISISIIQWPHLQLASLISSSSGSPAVSQSVCTLGTRCARASR